MVSSVSLIGTGEEMRIQLKEVDASRPIGAAGALFVDLGQALHASWVAGGSQGVDVMPIDDSTMVFVDGPNPELSGIVFPASQLATLDVRFEPYVKVGGERLFPMVYRVDAELSVLHNGAFEAVGGQQFLFKTMSYTQKEGPGGAR